MPRHFSKMRTRYNTLDSWGIWTPESSAWASHSLPALLLHCASWASGSFAFLNCIALNCIFKPTQEPWSQKKTMHHLRLHYEVSSALLSFKHVPTINWWIHFGAGVPSLKLPRSSCRAPPAICSRQPHLDMSDMYRSRWNLQ